VPPERILAKVGVEGSNPFARSKFTLKYRKLRGRVRDGNPCYPMAEPGRNHLSRDLDHATGRNQRSHGRQVIGRFPSIRNETGFIDVLDGRTPSFRNDGVGGSIPSRGTI
jgi:hypothetical protein